MAAATLTAGAALATPGGVAFEDRDITRAVEDQILFDEAVRLNDIDVVTNEGIVTLEGEVDNILARERATALAGTVRGVRSVINRIEIHPPLRSDQAIKQDIILALAENPAADSYEVSVRVNDGFATLGGTVDSWTESELCAELAKGVRGVTGVVNDIIWEVDSSRSDLEIQRDIEESLDWDVLLDAALVDVSVNEGAVTLSGQVGSLAERSRARSKAWVSGVSSVNSKGLEVMPNLGHEMERVSSYQPRSDEDIKSAVEAALLYDPRVYSPAIDVDVDAGVVHLSGHLDNLSAKRHAKVVAMNTTGVVSVRNRIRIRAEEGLEDETIERQVTNALVRDPYTEAFEIRVDARGGVVDLSGTVDSYFEKAVADDLAANTAGVSYVDNNIVVDSDHVPYIYSPYLDDAYYLYDLEWYQYPSQQVFASDAEIRKEIEDELWWSPFVDSDDVDVEVDAGVATLAGHVDTWSEWRAARENAFEGGASWVVNDLEVGPENQSN